MPRARREYIKRTTVSADEEQQIEEAFDMFKTNGPLFSLDALGLKGALEALGVGRLELEGSSVIDVAYDDFVQLMTWKFLEGCGPDQELTRAFELLDNDETSTITFKNLKRVNTELMMGWSDATLHQMMDEADTDGNGHVTVKQFKDIIATAFDPPPVASSVWRGTLLSLREPPVVSSISSGALPSIREQSSASLGG